MEVVVKISSYLFMLILAAVIMGFPIMWLWNWLMPDLFGLQVIGFIFTLLSLI